MKKFLLSLLVSVVSLSAMAGWVKTDLASIKATDIVVIVDEKGNYAMSNNNGTSKGPAGVVLTIANNKITSEVADNLKWNIVADGSNYTIYPNGTTETWLYCTNGNNGVRVGTNKDKVFTFESTHLKHTATSRYLGVYTGTPDWRCYTTYTTDNIKDTKTAFYVYTEGDDSGEGGGEEPGEGGGEEPGDDPVEPEIPSLPEGTLYYESFDKCANTGGNDGVWKGISGTPAIQFDNANNTHVKGYGASQCARFGTGKALGSFTTAPLKGLGSVKGGYAIIAFMAAAWNGDSNTIEVSIAGGGEFIAETSLTTKDAEWTEYSLGIAGGTANTTITISAVEESGNRFFLDEVKVMASTEDKVTGIEDTMVDENAPVEYYNLQGVKVANPENGIFIKKQGAKATKVVL